MLCSPVTLLRIARLMDGGDADLVDMFFTKCIDMPVLRKKGYWAVCDSINGWYADVLANFAFLWETSRNDPRWTEHGHIHLGLLKGKTGRCRAISAAYKRDVLTVTRNSIGTGVRSASQVLQSLAAVGTAGVPTRRSKMQRRMDRKRAARSQCKHEHASAASGHNMSKFEQYNYFLDCRTHFVL